MVDDEEHEVVTPDEKSLLQPTNICKVPIITDGEKTNKTATGKKILYACPAKGCPRNVESPRQQFFPALYNLKMHYLSVHGEKKLECVNCRRRFGNEVVFKHHMNQCKQQQTHDCQCGKSYTSRNALLTHAKRKQHPLTHAKRKQHPLAADEKVAENNSSSGVVTVPAILYIPKTQHKTKLNVPHPVKYRPNLQTNHPVTPPPKNGLPRLVRILPKTPQIVSSVIYIKHDKPVIQQGIPVISESKQVLVSQEHNVIPPKNILNSVLVPENLSKVDKSSINVQTKAIDVLEGVDKKSRDEDVDKKSRDEDVDKKSRHESPTCVPLMHGGSFDDVVTGKRKVKPLNTPRLCKQRKLYATTSPTKCRDVLNEINTKCQDVFNEINTSPKKLAHMCTQTSVTCQSIEEHPAQKKVNTNTQTQVNADDFLEDSPTRTTMDTQTQINYYNYKDVVKKSTMDTHTQINFNDKLRETLSIDTQTQINSYNFNDILKKLTMDTQTELSSYDFNLPPKSNMESMDTQTEINSYNFNDVCIRSTLETVDSQTEMNCYNFNKPVVDRLNDDDNKSVSIQTNMDNSMSIQTNMDNNVSIQTNMDNLKDVKLNFTNGRMSNKQCGVLTRMDKSATDNLYESATDNLCESATDNLFHFNDTETQTESVNPWLSDFPYQELTTMGTQTNFSDGYMQTNFHVGEALVSDKSIQLDNMISLNDTHDIVLTESSNISTQTVESEKDIWLNENLLCESSSTQTDFFEHLDFMDIDFHIDSNKDFGSNMTRYCKDTLISGNIGAENKSHMETQTTIPLLDMLDSPLNDNYMSMDKNIVDIQTQTTDIFPEMFYRPTSSIETQTDYF